MTETKSAGGGLSRRLFLGSAVVGAGLAGVAAGALAAGGSVAGPEVVRLPGERRRFADKVVLITGATSGIGRASAVAFAAEGAKVSFCGRRVELGRAVEAEIRQDGGEAAYFEADVRDPDAVRGFVDETVRRYGRLDVAFNNAGISFSKPLHEAGVEEWDDLQTTNVRGVFLAMKAEIPHMKAAGGGVILVTSSANAVASRPNLGVYNSSKRALVGLVQTAALEYAGDNIRVNAICPGATNTPMIRRQAGMEGAPDAAWNTAVGLWAQQNVHGLGRVASPAEIALAALSLCSDEMSYLTGSAVFVDGGMTAAL